MMGVEFNEKVKTQYPKLYDHFYNGFETGSYHWCDSLAREANYTGITEYSDLWNHIVKYEKLHELWML